MAIDKINIIQVFWDRYIVETAQRPGRVLGSTVSIAPVTFSDLAYPIATHFPGPVEAQDYISYFLYSLHDGRFLFGITHLSETRDRTAWLLSKTKSYCMIDDNLDHMIRFGMGDPIRILLNLEYDVSNTEVETISFLRKTQGSLMPIKSVL